MAPTDVHPLTTEIVDTPVPVVRVSGELDLSTAAQLCRAIQTAATTAVLRPPRVVVDLTRLDFCDSTGLRALIGAVGEVRVLGGKAVVAVTPGGALDRLLEMSGLNEFLRVADSSDEALKTLGAV
jgi:anti-sigma B factor antagonist